MWIDTVERWLHTCDFQLSGIANQKRPLVEDHTCRIDHIAEIACSCNSGRRLRRINQVNCCWFSDLCDKWSTAVRYKRLESCVKDEDMSVILAHKSSWSD